MTAGLAPTARAADGALRLPVTGTFKGGGDFAGTVTRQQICAPRERHRREVRWDMNLLGFQVALGAISLDIVGEEGTPLGGLVCAISELLGNVAAVVNLLNSLLGLLTGLLGGLLPTV